ncbi:U-box domain-containing protein 44-like isoform X1 [Zingiber officinale]|uniref:U-box domain-containing protein 44-like isoform X1 n=1 Tax=Zingiber officinale TaxID=94328 RepID=UPI001C4DBE97|nr:U-box domain-containing protein 44-like isoform X1 [Zingiber officinale]
MEDAATVARLLSRLMDAVDEAAALAAPPADAASPSSSRRCTAPMFVFSFLVARINPVLQSLLLLQQEVGELPDASSRVSALESLGAELRRARSLAGRASSAGASSYAASVAVRLVEGAARCLGRGLLVLAGAWADAPVEIRTEMDALRGEMMEARFDGPIEEVGGGPALGDAEDLVVRIKNADEDELWVVLFEIVVLTEEGFVGEEGGTLIPALLNRLTVTKGENRVKMIEVLRKLASHSTENKEKMAGVEALSTIVRSLSRNVDESREAVGLLLDLSEVLKVRQRIGRIQGCMVMLVTLRNGEDSIASEYAGRLLGVLSGNAHNVLLMAEAGYFSPLVRYLKEAGSEMNKILMANAISRMKLTDQIRSTLGEEGSIEPLVNMFTSGKLEAKLSALGALRNLSILEENIKRLIDSGAIEHLLQLLFSVTSVLVTLREPAAAILANIAESDRILTKKGMAPQMLSLLNHSSPAIQIHLFQALNRIASHSNAKRIRTKMRENGALQLLLPFLTESNNQIRIAALNLLVHISKDFDPAGECFDQIGVAHLNLLVNIIAASTSDNEKSAALGILSNLPLNDKRVTDILVKENLLPVLISLFDTTIARTLNPTKMCLLENIAGVMVRFTVPWDKKLQRTSASHGVISCLLKLLTCGSIVAKSKAAVSLGQLSQNTVALVKVKPARWLCVPSSSETFCDVHNGNCVVKTTFCLVKAGAMSPLVQILQGKDREADEAVLEALATLLKDEIWENGSNAIEKATGVQALVRVLEVGNLKAQEKAIWMLERIFRLEGHREKYGEAAQLVLIDLAQKANPSLKSMIAKILAHLQLLQMQSSYF